MSKQKEKIRFSTSLKYMDIPKNRNVKVYFCPTDPAFVSLEVELMSGTIFFSVRIDSEIGRMIFEKVSEIRFDKFKCYGLHDDDRMLCPEFEFKYDFLDLVKILEKRNVK